MCIRKPARAIGIWLGGGLTGPGVALSYYLAGAWVLVLPAVIAIIIARVIRVKTVILVIVAYMTLLTVVSGDLSE